MIAKVAGGRRETSAIGAMEGRLATLAGRFGVSADTVAIVATCSAIFRRALACGAPNSRLTQNGGPIQFATSVGEGGPAPLRFVGDPSPPGASAAERMRAAREALAEAADALGLSRELASLSHLLARFAPSDSRALIEDPAGVYWIGAAFAPAAPPALRIYVNGAWGERLAAQNRLRAFASCFDEEASWSEVERLAPSALVPLGLALTLAPGRPPRGAVYLRAFGVRLGDYVRLAEALAGPGAAAKLQSLGEALLGREAEHPTASAVFSVGLGRDGPLPTDLEFCAHCLYHDDAEAHRRLRELFAAQDLDAVPYETSARPPLPGHANLLAAAAPCLCRRGRKSFRPRLHGLSQPGRSVLVTTGAVSQIDAALRRGLDFVLAGQAPDGSWTDWALPPGPSPDWTTAYVGFRLGALRAPHRAVVEAPLDRAAVWLCSRLRSDGWGYSEAVEADADSTSLAILFLAALRAAAPAAAYVALRRHQRNDGGFSTFLPDELMGSWGSSHPEITPVAVLALRTGPGFLLATDEARALASIRRVRRPDGLWDAFWWESPLPACEANLACLAAVGRPEVPPEPLGRLTPEDPLQTALLLSLSAAREEPARLLGLADGLIASQSEDGSWRAAPSLRIPSRSCLRPWQAPGARPLYSDPRRLFTTATALAALGAARRVLATVFSRQVRVHKRLFYFEE